MGDGESLHVHCDFPTAEDEMEFMAQEPNLRPTDIAEIWMHLGGTGRATIFEKESGAKVEVFGAVRDLAPVFRRIADEFDRRLAELPTS